MGLDHLRGTVGRGKAPAWLELRTRDAFTAAIFYGEVLDWACERPDCCDVSYEHDHVVLRHGNDAVARISGGALEADPDPHVRPCWHVHFHVPDLEAAVEPATRLGGRAGAVSPVQTSPVSRWISLSDPMAQSSPSSHRTTHLTDLPAQAGLARSRRVR